ncbi:MAG: hypothetical protein ACKOVA_01420, partial [Novosphingobium sp.]
GIYFSFFAVSPLAQRTKNPENQGISEQSSTFVSRGTVSELWLDTLLPLPPGNCVAHRSPKLCPTCPP